MVQQIGVDIWVLSVKEQSHNSLADENIYQSLRLQWNVPSGAVVPYTEIYVLSFYHSYIVHLRGTISCFRIAVVTYSWLVTH